MTKEIADKNMEEVIGKLREKADDASISNRANGRRYLNFGDAIGEIGLPNEGVFTGGVSFKVVGTGGGGSGVLVLQPPQNPSETSYTDYGPIIGKTSNWKNSDTEGELKSKYDAFIKSCEQKPEREGSDDPATGLPVIFHYKDAFSPKKSKPLFQFPVDKVDKAAKLIKDARDEYLKKT
jgi:hypothetical protein